MTLLDTILIICGGAASLFCIFKLIKETEKIKWVLTLVLSALVFLLIHVVYETIAEPIRFRDLKEIRYNAVIQKLKDIRKAQIAYKDNRGVFADNFDQLIDFIKNDSLQVPRAIGSFPEDEMTLEKAIDSGLVITKLEPGMTVEDVLAQGIALRDTVQISFSDTLFRGNYPIDSLRYIPYSDGDEFHIAAGELETGSGVVVKVFEVVATNDQILKGLNDKYYRPSEELRVGSLTEATNHAGNWGE